MPIDLEQHRNALRAATHLQSALRYRGDYLEDEVRIAWISVRIREEWARLSETMPGVLAELLRGDDGVGLGNLP